MSTILITGATGTNGQALIQQLNLLQANYRIATRNVEVAKKKIKTNQSFVHFAFDQPETYEAAIEGIDKVFLLGPPLTLQLDQLLSPFIDFLSQKGIKRVVYFSALQSDSMGESLNFHQLLEEKLAHDGFDYTILRPSFFAQNFKNYEYENILNRQITFMPAGNGKVGFIDVDDIAAVAAKVLTEDVHSKMIYELTGPELLSYFDAAKILCNVMQREIVYPNPTPELFKNVLLESGAPAFVADYLINVYNTIAQDRVNYLTSTVEELLGRKPTSLQTVLANDFGNNIS